MKVTGQYVTKGRGLELERLIREVRSELVERVAHAEARAEAAERQSKQVIDALVAIAAKRQPPKEAAA